MKLVEGVQVLLDRGDIPWKKVIAGLNIAQFGFETYLATREYKKLNELSLPSELEGVIDKETMQKTQAYERAKLRYRMVRDLVFLGLNLVMIKYDWLPRMWNLGVAVGQRMPAMLVPVSTISQSLYFLIVYLQLNWWQGLFGSYYYNFVLEEKFGFNKSTVKLWLTDQLKVFMISSMITTPAAYALLKVIEKFSTGFVSYVSILMLFFYLVLTALQPVFTALFNKLTPLEDGELKTSIVEISKRVNFPLDKIYLSDGSRRSAHSNAYFTGLPFFSKRIVLFDTLVNDSTVEEVVAVMGHEIGHWKLNHISYRLLLLWATSGFTVSLFSAIYMNTSLYEAYGFFIGNNASSDPARVVVSTVPVMIGFMLFNDLFQPAGAALQFITNWYTQYQELQADQFAKELGYQDALGSSLIMLARGNLHTPEGDPLYTAYHDSHPSTIRRLRALQYKPAKKQ
ncbi:ABR163Wp [Eremothecium gossypii ATCC 10895]|uniref:CAAX prenyl protease n=1 Tax=Eremothecium gossypii (strain ATCC 10895 / CBS 109.51 / FGSC 9923 / NRRL Y-1056) TaxID=284811 RepID=Q75D60_EREGS|nr:ABR163Wp [Eremothecium gossypii ATCC 10895]AAS50935.1 ABR163Wp [Eremothecium gossypii ATCC 10895]AEY95225.1 FABR163Wp [Eremothecium gossypii FDAG1]